MKEHQHAHQPYTYLIRFKPTCQLYYGVRFRKGCDPKELWVSYFTSSKVIHDLISTHGIDSFDVQVRRVFKNAINARKCESRVHRYFKVKASTNWLNLHEAGELHFLRAHSDQTKALMRERAKYRDPYQYVKTGNALRGRKQTQEHIDKIADARRGHKQKKSSIEQRVAKNSGKKRSKSQLVTMSNAQKGLRMYANIATGELKRFRESPTGDWFLWNNKWGLPKGMRELYPRELFVDHA